MSEIAQRSYDNAHSKVFWDGIRAKWYDSDPTPKRFTIDKKQFETFMHNYRGVLRKYNSLYNSSKDKGDDRTWADFPKDITKSPEKYRSSWPVKNPYRVRHDAEGDDDIRKNPKQFYH